MAKLQKFICISAALLLGFSLVSPLSAKDVKDPGPARFKGSIESFRQWDSKNSSPDEAVLFVGSSSIRMWKTAEAFPGLDVINRGFGGSHISDIIHYCDDVISGYSPAVIVFYAGDNDAASGKPPEQIFKDYQQLLSKIRDEYPSTPFVYLPIKPASSRWKYWDQMSETNQIIRRFNQKHENLYYADTASALLTEQGRPNDKLFLKDRLHLNKKGYEIWNSILRPRLTSIYEKLKGDAGKSGSCKQEACGDSVSGQY
ncbi:Argininosuccinate lyase [Sedimentisphaera cyanobacteriorum]|uniref:Argininosuccinate lyase n=1 Tax=Sedimentisphaera cyanobacteriorum TaxID=1940790 RepID=A0A1Q2HS52_9BACT|nr:GDSL-type esterase/lipase family protein [Sedimentisphaera cyanobacteriorum]AQQ10065.1 Argininosuccinate lyase [Sedimentisphaera cyanobacteriorum]